jgi:hypothetical protein
MNDLSNPLNPLSPLNPIWRDVYFPQQETVNHVSIQGDGRAFIVILFILFLCFCGMVVNSQNS